jgi:hypothetical protein
MMDAVLEAWLEWKRRCALGLCEPGAQATLEKFAYSRFSLYARRYAATTNVKDANALCPSGHDAWHLLETHMAASKTAGGKHYKDWLFDRVRDSGDPSLSVIESGASVLIRSVVRENLRREFSAPNMISENTVVYGEGDSALTIQDLLPGGMSPADAVAQREFEQLAKTHAGELVPGLSWREKLVLFAKSLGIALSHPEVEAAAECRKTVLNDAYKKCVHRITVQVQDQYANEEPDSVMLLSLLTINEAMEITKIWGKSEKRLAHFFSITGA